jgi:endonuclease/exonuclease/phosphatase family metal-dependent hydrolase
MRNKTGLVLLLSVCFFAAQAQELRWDTCKIVTYNVLNFDNTGNDKEQYLREVIDSLRPDVLVVQELIEISGADRFFDSVVHKLDTNYAMGTFINSFDTDNGIYYRKDKFEFISNEVITTELRDINEFKLKHILSNYEIYFYSLHLKASSGGENANQRKREVDSLRKVTDLLPDTANFIVAGDFNIYNSSEAAYVALLDQSNTGYVIDPLDGLLSTTWNSASNAPYHTQSTRIESFGGGSTGGLDDRFDMLLHSQAIEDFGGITLLTGSYHAIGNDGAHFDDAMNDLPNAAVSASLANALYMSSDHIPLEAKYVFEYIADTSGNIDTTLAVYTFEPSFRVFPNPVNQSLHIQSDVLMEAVSIFSADGNLVANYAFNRTSVTIPADALPQGMYIAKIQCKEGFFQRTFVKF